MAHVVEYEEFEKVMKRIEALETDNQFFKALLLGQKWLSRKQTYTALGVSAMTLDRLRQANAITYRYEGTKPLYCIDSVRDYMKNRKIEGKAIDQRLISALQAR
ncbi:hypothetical protein [Fibrella forsythiae]|uniref:DNA-binding protein n=1 Tax=Fibrella forsythiae TaxID=2817061 RepID=A0ABS3JC33_9BACT|nr:hypothetical protein [Fibrella forsythiae]MBO0947561.1 hypothetical protein [Fibrella forsythiae]